jgi:hypothetical protein
MTTATIDTKAKSRATRRLEVLDERLRKNDKVHEQMLAERDALILQCHSEFGMSVREIASHLSIKFQTVAYTINRDRS